MAAQDSFRRIHGSCHCGNIRFRFDWPGLGQSPVRACGCDHCRKHRGVWTSHPQGRFTLSIADPFQSGQYNFGTNTPDFHVCRTCGIVPIVTFTIDGARYAVVNVNAFDNVDRSELTEATTNFEERAPKIAWRVAAETGPRKPGRATALTVGLAHWRVADLLEALETLRGPHAFTRGLGRQRSVGDDKTGRATSQARIALSVAQLRGFSPCMTSSPVPSSIASEKPSSLRHST